MGIKIKRGAGRVWGCLTMLASLITGFVVGMYLYYKPGESEGKGFLTRATEITFVIATGCAITVTAWMGGWTDMSSALAIVAVADYVTGFAAACFRKSKKTKSGGLSSKVGFFGIMKKVMMFVAIIVAHQVDIVVSNGVNTIRDIITGCLIANEALSFYENVALFGVPFPKKLRRILDQLRDPEDDPPSKTINNMKESG